MLWMAVKFKLLEKQSKIKGKSKFEAPSQITLSAEFDKRKFAKNFKWEDQQVVG